MKPRCTCNTTIFRSPAKSYQMTTKASPDSRGTSSETLFQENGTDLAAFPAPTLASVGHHQRPGFREGQKAPGYTCIMETSKDTPSANLEQQTCGPPCSFHSPGRLSALRVCVKLNYSLQDLSPPHLSHAVPLAMAFSLRSSCPEAQGKHYSFEALLTIQAPSSLTTPHLHPFSS